MTEDDFLCALPLADRLKIAAVDLAVTGAPRALVAAVWEAGEKLDARPPQARRRRPPVTALPARSETLAASRAAG